MNGHNQMTKLDEQLREMAILNWDQFTTLIGKENITRAKICMLRGAGSSFGQIAVKLGMKSRHQARHAGNNCNNCDLKGSE